MIDGRGLSADVHMVGNAGGALGKELHDIIVEGLMQSADKIRDFAARKGELFNIGARWLVFFSMAVCLYFARTKKRWDEAKVTNIIDDLTAAMARSFRYTSESVRSDEDTARARQECFESLLHLYEHVSASFDRVKSGALFRDGDEEASHSLFALNMMYLSQAWPGSAALVCSLRLEELRVLARIQSEFGTAVWSAFRHLES